MFSSFLRNQFHLLWTLSFAEADSFPFELLISQVISPASSKLMWLMMRWTLLPSSAMRYFAPNLSSRPSLNLYRIHSHTIIINIKLLFIACLNKKNLAQKSATEKSLDIINLEQIP